MRCILPTVLRVTATVIILAAAVFFVYRMMHKKPCNCSGSKAKRAQVQERDYRFDGSAPLDSIQDFLRDFGFTSKTSLVAGCAGEVIDSLCEEWSRPGAALFEKKHFSLFEGLGAPNIECSKQDGAGYVKYNYAFIAAAEAETTATDTPRVYIYNRTAIVSQRDDKTSVLHLYEMPQPIPLRRFSRLLKMPFGQTQSSDNTIPYPGAKSVFNYGSNGASGVTAWWLPCSADSAMTYCLGQLKKDDWQVYKRGEENTLLLTRGDIPKETLAISIIGDPESASGSLVVMSFQGRGSPFSKGNK